MSFSGDVGIGSITTQGRIRGDHTTTDAVPYLNFDYGPVFARIDTVGVKTLPLGYGNLEIVGQYRGDGYKVSPMQRRDDSVPIGLGTMQITPFGAFGLNALYDFGKSNGTLVQARYLAEFPFGRVTIYPELGAEYQNKAYTGYYYGTTGLDDTALGRSYSPGAAFNPYFGLLVETKLTDKLYLNAYFKETTLDHTLAKEPFGPPRDRAALLLALAYRF
jgi:outer membrane scaffolding protein for murein synthesis (MipA/OmpV family)